jgi:hypothetical protein
MGVDIAKVALAAGRVVATTSRNIAPVNMVVGETQDTGTSNPRRPHRPKYRSCPYDRCQKSFEVCERFQRV